MTYSRPTTRLGVLIAASGVAALSTIIAPTMVHPDAVPAAWAQTCPHVIDRGHQDVVIDPGAHPAITVNDEGTTRTAGSFVVAVPDRTYQQSDLPSLPAQVWYLDQSGKDPELPWFGFSTTGPAEISLSQVQGPGRVVAWHSGLTGPSNFVLDSTDPGAKLVYDTSTHDHVNWAFSEAGRYKLNFRILASGQEYDFETTFLVGDAAIADSCSLDAGTPPTGSPGTTDSAPGAFAKDLNSITSGFNQLDREWGRLTAEVNKALGVPTKSPSSPSSPSAAAAARGPHAGAPSTTPAPTATALPPASGAPGAPDRGTAHPPARAQAPATAGGTLGASTGSAAAHNTQSPTSTPATPAPGGHAYTPGPASPGVPAPGAGENHTYTAALHSENVYLSAWLPGFILGIGTAAFAVGGYAFLAAQRLRRRHDSA